MYLRILVGETDIKRINHLSTNYVYGREGKNAMRGIKGGGTLDWVKKCFSEELTPLRLEGGIL